MQSIIEDGLRWLMADMPEDRTLRDEKSLRFFLALCSRDQNSRSHALENISRALDAWVDGYGSPQEAVYHNNHHDARIQPLDRKPLVKELLPDLLRFSIYCPFEDVRSKCGALLLDLQERGLKIPRRVGRGPSRFIPENEIVPVDTDDEETQMLFVDAFLQNNRLEHIVQVMGYHPKYLDSFLKTQQYILRGDGPLPYDYRHYIAIMASARHQCSYLINLHKTEFLLCGGEETWLKGLDHIPQKLRDLYEIIKILAHRPWLISKNHIEKLTRGNDNWSLAEVMHALIIIAHFHAMCSFVYGCGIHPEIDEENGHTFRPSSSSDSEDNHSSSNSHSGSPTSTDAAAGIEALMERMKQLNETGEEPTQEEMLARFQKVESQSLELEAGKSQLSPKASILCYVEDPSFGYEDFAMRGAVQEIPTFRAQDFSWEDQGYSLANRLYSDIGTLLDDKFNTAYNLTYFTMGPNTDVDTSSFRRAIWNYIHCMYGIRHDDYNYGEVNHLLERYLKSYVKTVTCYPERVSKKDYDNFMRGFKHSEKVHVNLMLLEAKMQAELLYSLRALTRYMT